MKRVIKRITIFLLLGTMLFNTCVFGAGTVQYSDVSNHPFSTYILKYAEKGMVSGYPDGTFKPDNRITRAEVTALLGKLNLYSVNSDSKSFVDVDAGDWYYEAVNHAVKTGVVKGYDGNVFKPQSNITRFEAISIISNFVRSENYNVVQLPYSDKMDIPLWVNNAVRNLYAAGIIKEYDGNQINGNEPISRGEIVAMLAKVMEKLNWDTSEVAKTAFDNTTNPLPKATEIPHDLLGYLTIDSIDIKSFPVKDGSDLTTIKTAIGHFAESATWDGNVSLCGHNRDYKYDFRNLKNINVGDIVVYKTRFGERTYTVTVKKEIEETDWSNITEKSDMNKITMMTCIESQPTKRLLVQAVQK